MPDLIACYWTVSGPVEIHSGREWSLFDWPDRCAHAARVGFAGLGLWHSDITHQLETRSMQEIVAIFRDAGLTQIEIEFLQEFYRPEGSPEKEAADATKRMLFDAAAAFDAHHIKTGNLPATVVDIDQLAEALAGVCAEAAEQTDAKIAYEIVPSDPQIHSLDAALDLVQRAGSPANLGITIDTWHMSKLGIPPAEVAAAVDQIAWIELSDGHFENLDDFRYEVTCDRRLVGEGEFDIPGYVTALHAAGYAGPWGAEVLWDKLRELPIDEAFDRAWATTSAPFAAL